MSSRKSTKDLSKYSSGNSIRRISPHDGNNKTRRMMKYATSVAYDSTIGALKKGKIPIVDNFVEFIYRVYQQKVRGRTREDIDKGVEADKKKVKDVLGPLTKRRSISGGKRANKTRKNVSHKNRK